MTETWQSCCRWLVKPALEEAQDSRLATLYFCLVGHLLFLFVELIALRQVLDLDTQKARKGRVVCIVRCPFMAFTASTED